MPEGGWPEIFRAYFDDCFTNSASIRNLTARALRDALGGQPSDEFEVREKVRRSMNDVIKLYSHALNELRNANDHIQAAVLGANSEEQDLQTGLANCHYAFGAALALDALNCDLFRVAEKTVRSIYNNHPHQRRYIKNSIVLRCQRLGDFRNIINEISDKPKMELEDIDSISTMCLLLRKNSTEISDFITYLVETYGLSSFREVDFEITARDEGKQIFQNAIRDIRGPLSWVLALFTAAFMYALQFFSAEAVVKYIAG